MVCTGRAPCYSRAMDGSPAADFTAPSLPAQIDTSLTTRRDDGPELRFAPFVAPVHFVFRGRKAAWPDLFDDSPPPHPDMIPNRIVEVEECWIVQTYLRLWHAGLNVTLSDVFEPSAINIVSYHDLAIRDRLSHFYVVATQHDAPRPEICDQRVVQNELNILTATDHFIPHWPQPGLIPRDSTRGSRIETLCFKGSECNLYRDFRTPEFIASLKRIGVRLQFDLKEGVERSSLGWNDYRTCDLVLAVRDATEEDLKLKPASKLINAWIAGAPALLGPEPAFAVLRQSEFDYVEVRTPQDVLNAVERLAGQPMLYQAMVERGRQRGEEFQHRRITARWHALIAGPVTDDFQRRKSRSPLVKSVADPATFAARALLHKRNLKRYLRSRDHGFRPISNRYT